MLTTYVSGLLYVRLGANGIAGVLGGLSADPRCFFLFKKEDIFLVDPLWPDLGRGLAAAGKGAGGGEGGDGERLPLCPKQAPLQALVEVLGGRGGGTGRQVSFLLVRHQFPPLGKQEVGLGDL